MFSRRNSGTLGIDLVWDLDNINNIYSPDQYRSQIASLKLPKELQLHLQRLFDNFKGLKLQQSWFNLIIQLIEKYYDEGTKKLDAYNFLLNFPGAVNPNIYYFWVELTLSGLKENQIKEWHIKKAIQMDEHCGDLELISQLFNLAIKNLGFDPLFKEVQIFHLVYKTSNEDLSSYTAEERLEISKIMDVDLKDYINWDFYEAAQYLYRLTRLGYYPEMLLNWLIENFNSLCNINPEYYLLLDLPPDIHDSSKNYFDVYGEELQVKYIQSCLLNLFPNDELLSPKVDQISSIMNLIILYTSITEDMILSSTILLKMDHLTANYIQNQTNSFYLLPHLQFLLNNREIWEEVEEFGYRFPGLQQRLYRTLAGTPHQHQLWCIGLIRETLNANEALNVLSFWKSLDKLRKIGYFGPLTEKQVYLNLLEALLVFEKIDSARSLMSIKNLPVKTMDLEELAIEVSKEFFDNQPDLYTFNSIKSSLDCLNSITTSENITKHKQFYIGAHELYKFYKKFNIEIKPHPLQIRLNPTESLMKLLNNPRSNLHKDLKQVKKLCSQLNLTDISFNQLIVDVLINKKDFYEASKVCFEWTEEEDISFNHITRLIKHNEFNDNKVKLKLLSKLATICPIENLDEYMRLYKDIEIYSYIPLNLQIQAKKASSIYDKLKLISNKLSSFNLKEHPMYSPTIHGEKFSMYDGSGASSLSSCEAKFRIANILMELTEDSQKDLQKELLKAIELELCHKNQSSIYNYIIFELSEEQFEQFFKKLDISIENIQWEIYHYALRWLKSWIMYNNSNIIEPISDLTLIQPSILVNWLYSRDIPKLDENNPYYNSLISYHDKFLNKIDILYQLKEDDALMNCYKDLSIDQSVFDSLKEIEKKDRVISMIQTDNFETIQKVLKLNEFIGIEHNQLLFHVYQYFILNNKNINEDTISSLILELKVDHQLKSQLDHLYSKINGNNLKMLLNYFNSYFNIINNSDFLDISEKKMTSNQLKLRIDILEQWVTKFGTKSSELKQNEEINFKLFLIELIQRDFSSLEVAFSHIINEKNVKFLLDTVPEYLEIQPIFEDDEKEGVTRFPNEPEILKSKLILWFVIKRISFFIKKKGMALPEDISSLFSYFEHLNIEDSLVLIHKICSDDYSQTIPAISQRRIVDEIQKLVQNNSNNPELDNFSQNIAPIIKKLDLIESLDELVDPFTEEDLGFITIKKIVYTNFESSADIESLWCSLLDEGTGLWLIIEAAKVLLKYHYESMCSWKESLEGDGQEFLINIFKKLLMRQIEERKNISIVQQMPVSLDKYNTENWAIEVFDAVQRYLSEDFLLNNKILPDLRLEVIFLLFKHYKKIDFRDIEYLLETKCFLLIERCYKKSFNYSDILNDEGEQRELIDLLLQITSDNPFFEFITLFNILVIISNYYLISTASTKISDFIFDLFYCIFEHFAQKPLIDPDLIYKFYVYFSPHLNSTTEKHSKMLTTLQNHQPINYYRIGFYVDNRDIFFHTKEDYFSINPYDFNLESDPIIFALLIIRHESVGLFEAHSSIFKDNLCSALDEELSSPYILDKVIRDLSLDFSNLPLMEMAEDLVKKHKVGFLKGILRSKRDTLIRYLRNDEVQFALPSNITLPDKISQEMPTLDNLIRLLNPDEFIKSFEEVELMSLVWDGVAKFKDIL